MEVTAMLDTVILRRLVSIYFKLMVTLAVFPTVAIADHCWEGAYSHSSLNILEDCMDEQVFCLKSTIPISMARDYAPEFLAEYGEDTIGYNACGMQALHIASPQYGYNHCDGSTALVAQLLAVGLAKFVTECDQCPQGVKKAAFNTAFLNKLPDSVLGALRQCGVEVGY